MPSPPIPSKSTNCPSFSSITPSYLLKVTKFLDNISQFNFLVVTEKNIFTYKLFLSLNISDFNLFFTWKIQHPPPCEKSHSSSFPAPPLKVLSSPPVFENLVGGSTSPPSPPPHPSSCRNGVGGAHYGCSSVFCWLWTYNLSSSMCFRVKSRSPVTFKKKLSVETFSNSSQLLSFLLHKAPS